MDTRRFLIIAMLDGSFNMTNLERDTSSNNVLISDHFYYFGNKAIEVDLDSIEYHRIRTIKILFKFGLYQPLIWLKK